MSNLTTNSPPMTTTSSTTQFHTCIHHLLSSSTPPALRAEANAWLERFQLSPEAWIACHEALISSPGEDVAFLAARILNRKVRYDLDQLPNDLVALREALIGYALVERSPPTRTQLALALVALTIQMTEWTNALGDLIRIFAQSKPLVLLEVLRLLPEEIDEASLDVQSSRRFAFKQEMLDSTTNVMTVLDEAVVSPTQSLKAVFDCARSWIYHSDVHGPTFARLNVVRKMFHVLDNGEPGAEFEAAVELAIEAVHRYRTLDSDDVDVVKVMVPGIFHLSRRYEKACADGTEDVVVGIARVFCHLAEAYVGVILGSDEVEQVNLVTLALVVYSHPDYRIARKSIYFWMDFFDGLARVEPPQLMEAKLNQFAHIFAQFVDVSMRRLNRTEDVIESDDEEDVGPNDISAQDAGNNDNRGGFASEFEEHRYDVGDLLRRLAQSTSSDVQSNAVIIRMCETCVRLAQAAQTDVSILSQYEGALTGFKYVANDLCWAPPNSKAGGMIREVLNGAFNSSLRDVSVRKTTCDALRELSQHFSNFPEAGYVSSAVLFLIDSIRANNLASQHHAARALRGVVVRCADQCIGLLERACTSCDPFSTTTTLVEDVRLDIVESLTMIWAAAYARALSNGGLSQDLDRLNWILRSQLIERGLDLLSGMVQMSNTPMMPVTLTNVAIKALGFPLHMLSCIVRYSTLPRNVCVPDDSRPEVVKSLLDKIWPALPSFESFLDSALEALCQFIKHATRTYPSFTRPETPRILEFVLMRYAKQPHPALLYCAGVMVSEFYGEDDLAPMFSVSLRDLISKTFTSILSTPESFKAFPDYVTDVFYLGDRAVTHLPHVLIQLESFEILFGMACRVGVCLDHRDAFRSVAIFLEHALALGIVSEHPDVPGGDEHYRIVISASLDRHGSVLMNNLLDGASGALSPDRLHDPNHSTGSLADVLYALFEFLPEQRFASTLMQALTQLPFLTNEMRGTFHDRLINTARRFDKHEFIKICEEFGASASRRRSRTA